MTNTEIAMALTVGTGPFGGHPTGSFNFEIDRPEHALYLDPSPKRVRAVVAGEVVAESTRTSLLHETGLMPVYYFPEEDLRDDLLEPSDTTSHCPFKGDASYWTLRVGDRVERDLVWGYESPKPEAPELSGLRAFFFDRVDEWWEEAERIGVHPRDPYHRLDVVRSDRHVRVTVDGQVLAESRGAVALFETGLPPRWYLPPEDVDRELLEPSETRTACPYKGTTTRYYHARVAGDRVDDAAWVYDEPHAEVAAIAGRFAFFDEKVDIELDGTPTRR